VRWPAAGLKLTRGGSHASHTVTDGEQQAQLRLLGWRLALPRCGQANQDACHVAMRTRLCHRLARGAHARAVALALPCHGDARASLAPALPGWRAAGPAHGLHGAMRREGAAPRCRALLLHTTRGAHPRSAADLPLYAGARACCSNNHGAELSHPVDPLILSYGTSEESSLCARGGGAGHYLPHGEGLRF
jgi:hypothetical protein